MRLEEWADQMKRTAYSRTPLDCDYCSARGICASLNRQDTTEPREDDDALCFLIAEALEEADVIDENRQVLARLQKEVAWNGMTLYPGAVGAMTFSHAQQMVVEGMVSIIRCPQCHEPLSVHWLCPNCGNQG